MERDRPTSSDQPNSPPTAPTTTSNIQPTQDPPNHGVVANDATPTQSRPVGASNAAATASTSHGPTGHPATSSNDRLDSAAASVAFDHRSTRNLDQALPPLPRMNDAPVQALRRARTFDRDRPGRTASGLDWIVPVEERIIQPPRPKTVEERLGKTLTTAKAQREHTAKKARNTGYILNTAIGLQVLLGSLTTGLSAVATTGRQTAIQTTILGGLTTIIASYLAKQRGSGEPELSKSRAKDLDKFIRQLDAYILDYGHCYGPEYDAAIEKIRNEYEEIMGNGTSDPREKKPVSA